MIEILSGDEPEQVAFHVAQVWRAHPEHATQRRFTMMRDREDWQHWRASALSGSLFAETRCDDILLTKAPVQEEQQILRTVLAHWSPEDLLILRASFAHRSHKWVKEAEAAGAKTTEFKPLRGAAQRQWLATYAHDKGVNMSDTEFAQVAASTAGNLSAARNALELASLTEPPQRDFSAMAGNMHVSLFSFVQVALAGKADKALAILEHTRREYPNSEVPMLRVLGRTIQQLCQVASAIEAGKNARQALDRAGLGYASQRRTAQATISRLGRRQLERIAARVAQVEGCTMSVRTGDPKIELRVLVLALCQCYPSRRPTFTIR